jgi:two-component system, OmpR family, sensor kinase
MSIHLRLTLLYSTILALTLLLFSTVLYVIQSETTLNIIRQDLVENAGALVGAWTRFHRSWDGGSPRPPPPPGPQDRAYRAEAQRILQPVVREEVGRDAVHILDADGSPLDLPINEESEALPITEAGLAELRSGTAWMEIAHGGDARWLVYNLPVVTEEDQVIGIVQLARPLIDRDRSLRSLGLTLVVISMSTTLIAFGIGWVLAGAALDPIRRITETARRIGTQRDFASRVDYKGPHDELGGLAMTFNEMLAHLEDAYKQVAHALRVQREFVTDVSHELRTPLTTIGGNLALLRRQPALPVHEQGEILADLTAESERMTRLVTDLLTLAQADAGRQLTLLPVSVEGLVERICRQGRTLAPDREMTYSSTIGRDEALDLIALADEDALRQVLLILVDNAVRHAQGSIQISTGRAGERVWISVRDGGPGLSAEIQQRVFDRFYRGDVSRSTPGFGLGLAIARSLVEAQQGALDVESTLGEGSTFTVSIPAA